MEKFEYATLEWLWDNHSIRINLPGNREMKVSGSYPEIAHELSKLGAEGWETSTCTSGGNWLFWTLKRVTSGMHVKG